MSNRLLPGTGGSGGTVAVPPTASNVQPLFANTGSLALSLNGGGLIQADNNWDGRFANPSVVSKQDPNSVVLRADYASAMSRLTALEQAFVAGFNPATLDNLRGWYSADSGYSIDGNGLSKWVDKSPTAQNLVSGHPTHNPTAMPIGNGSVKPYLRFNGTSNWLYCPAFNYGVTKDITVFVAFRSTMVGSGGDAQMIFCTSDDINNPKDSFNCFSRVDDATHRHIEAFMSPSMGSAAAPNWFNNNNYLAQSHDGWELLCVRQWNSNGTLSGTSLSGAVTTATGTTANIPTNNKPFYLGAQGDGYFGGIDVYEVIIFGDKLTPAEEASVKSYLAFKYSLGS